MRKAWHKDKGMQWVDCVRSDGVEPPTVGDIEQRRAEVERVALCACGATAEPDFNGGHFGECPAARKAGRWFFLETGMHTQQCAACGYQIPENAPRWFNQVGCHFYHVSCYERVK